MSQPQHERGPDPQAADGGISGDAEVLTVEAQLEQARAQADEERQKAESHLDLARRAQADFQNYKRRTATELEQKVKEANASLLTQLLPAFDDLQLALTNVPADMADQAWPKGIGLISQKLDHLLQLQGLQRIGNEGELFDPHVHEAVAYESHPVYDEGQVASVYRVGYRLNERVLRPAQVVVARGSSKPPAAAGGESRSVGEGTAHS